MTLAIAAVMVVGLAAVIVYPLLTRRNRDSAVDAPETRELLEREKTVALVAIREADQDRAMGKLSDEDYGILRAQYEHRAVRAFAALDELPSAGDGNSGAPQQLEHATRDRFCRGCGRAFGREERFCPACGRPRGALA
jgi:hypothetical protein